jgi:uncharacterized protein YukE
LSDHVSASPDEIRGFARALNSSNHQLRDLLLGLNARLGQLAETWRDKEFEKFEATFTSTVMVLNRFLDEADEYVRYLNRKAEPLEEYLHQRP